MNQKFHWTTPGFIMPGPCEEIVSEVNLVEGYVTPDFDTTTFSLAWPAVSCTGGYDIYVRDDLHNPEWSLLQTDPTDYEWGEIQTICTLPESFDRYQVDTDLTPLAGRPCRSASCRWTQPTPLPGRPTPCSTSSIRLRRPSCP